MTWWREGEHYGAFFNRDELKTRPRAEPPFAWSGGFLSPRDPAAGGTWLAVNQNGLILALLNRWHEGAKGTKSRGLIIPALIGSKNTEEEAVFLNALPLADYSPFTLVAIDSLAARRYDWNGEILSNDAAEAPITSSSFRFKEVRDRRRATYRKITGSEPAHPRLAEFHSECGQGAYSIRMCRPDAQTWSRSRIEVSPENVTWEYAEEFLDHRNSSKIWNTTLARSTFSA